MSKDDGGPAFPGEQTIVNGQWNQTWNPGLSLLDWFAGQTLAGVLADGGIAETKEAEKKIAQWCYDQAEAMLVEMRKREKRDG